MYRTLYNQQEDYFTVFNKVDNTDISDLHLSKVKEKWVSLSKLLCIDQSVLSGKYN